MKVLVVDDEEVTRAILRRILEKNLFCEVHDAESGVGGWAAMASTLARNDAAPGTAPATPYDLCILDVMMPKGNGLELLNRIRAEPQLADLKIILCSAITGRTSLGHFEAFKPDGNIIKPFTVPAVLEEVKRVMSTSRRQS